MDKDIKKEKTENQTKVSTLHKKDPIEKIAPKVSVQIITKNRAKLLPLAIESALSQTYKNIEIIIVDNNSTDKTEEMVRRYISIDARIKYFRIVENLGITKTRNFALSKSTGSYVAVLDSDDFWLTEDKLEKQVDFLLKNPEYAIVGTDFIVVDINNKEIKIKKQLGSCKETDDDIKKNFLIKNQLIHSSVLMNKNFLQEIGYYDEKYQIWEDYALFLKIGRSYKIHNLKEKTTAYRKHPDNISNFNKIKNLLILMQIIFDNRIFYQNFLISIFLINLRIIGALFKKY
jgi:glycosyltransferase involved in cell wall biosynthesis